METWYRWENERSKCSIQTTIMKFKNGRMSHMDASYIKPSYLKYALIQFSSCLPEHFIGSLPVSWENACSRRHDADIGWSFLAVLKFSCYTTQHIDDSAIRCSIKKSLCSQKNTKFWNINLAESKTEPKWF